MAVLQFMLVHGIDWNISETGHGFLSLVMAFLLVSRVTTSLARYDAARESLEVMNKTCRQLVHTACVYSMSSSKTTTTTTTTSNNNNNDDNATAAKEWRHEVTLRSLLLLRTAMAVIDYPSTHVRVLDIPELMRCQVERQELLQYAHATTTTYSSSSSSASSSRLLEENMRIPIGMSYLLRKSIRSQEERLQPCCIPVVAEGDLHALVNAFLDGYHGITKLLTTPVPFSLIQMTSTFLWFYIFTVPFALLSADDTSWVAIISHCAVAFVMTFGFVGMDLISQQLDDPFGEDENDFK